MDFAKRIEQLFLPPYVALAGGLLLLAYLNWNLHDSITLLSTFLAYWIVVLVFRDRMKNENNIYASGGLLALPIFFTCLILLDLSKEVIFFEVSLLSILVAVYLIRPRWKISAHSASAVAVATILSLVNPGFSVLFLILPPIIWSRFKLRAHTLTQVVMGLLLGFIASYMSYWLVEIVLAL